MTHRFAQRTALGANFNEGARLLWLAMASEGLSQLALSRELGIRTPGVQSRWLWGDQRPLNPWRKKIKERFGVPVDAWDESPVEPFVPPVHDGDAAAAAAPVA